MESQGHFSFKKKKDGGVGVKQKEGKQALGQHRAALVTPPVAISKSL